MVPSQFNVWLGGNDIGGTIGGSTDGASGEAVGGPLSSHDAMHADSRHNPTHPLNAIRLIRMIDQLRFRFIKRQIGRKMNFLAARQPEKMSMPKDIARVYR